MWSEGFYSGRVSSRDELITAAASRNQSDAERRLRGGLHYDARTTVFQSVLTATAHLIDITTFLVGSHTAVNRVL